jgi:NAD+ diphosphatase
MGQQTFTSGIVPPEEHMHPALWFAFRGEQLLVQSNGTSVSIPLLTKFEDLGLPFVRRNYLGHVDACHCYAVELAEETEPPAGMAFQGLRQVYGSIPEKLFSLAGTAKQIVEWDRNNQFCGRCGTPMEMSGTERAKECPRCGLLRFPRLAPAVIVLVERGPELLLARAYHFAPGLYSVIAGFVEPGETLEEAVAREVREEVGISVRNIRYFGSQHWPFPHSLMIGFTAVYAGGEISRNDGELEDAGWYTADNLPQIPGKISISRKLIDWYLAKHGKAPDEDGVKG